MRLRFCFLFIVLAGISFAQDTNFSAGPQYLINTGSPLLLQSIATPSLSFGSGLSDPYLSSTELAPSQITSPVSSSTADTATNVYLGEVMWGVHPADTIIARRMDTPIVSADQIATYTYSTTSEASNTLPNPLTVPIESVTPTSVIELASTTPANLPPSMINPGVTGTADVQSLLNRGYGVSLGDFAMSMKSRKRPGVRVFTNEDLQRK
ncbi:MAG TPA: hypothetical protein VMP68_25220 [Candidatus Eisenbacteria bacterium]|nr:hypothetical protein [Candidatus Eisenbacteria bacterium]